MALCSAAKPEQFIGFFSSDEGKPWPPAQKGMLSPPLIPMSHALHCRKAHHKF
jgi:hypothetical protein